MGVPVSAPMANANTSTHENNDPNINAGKYPDVLFPNDSPPHGTTHYHGRWNVNAGGRFWEVYPNPIEKSQLPSNVSSDDEHWYNQWHPNGKFVNYQGVQVPLTHCTHPDYLKNRPPPTVTFDPNITVASTLPMTPVDSRITGTRTVQHPPPAGAMPVQHPTYASINSSTPT
jgi:hypothetical protein